MEEAEAAEHLCSGSADDPWSPFSLVSLSPFSHVPCPPSRRLSSHFTPSQPVPSARRLAWVSLQGRLVNAEEAGSAKSVCGGLIREEALAWELFTPMQRFLLVAVIGVAVSESKKNRHISRLKKSVELRDQVLNSMQQKLDTLCDELNNIKSLGELGANAKLNKDSGLASSDAFGCEKIKFVDCGCWHCDQHQDLYASMMGHSAVKIFSGDEVLQYKTHMIDEGEQEERRMSDLSDWASSVTSAADIQMNSFVIEHDVFNLKRECEEKDATIKELTTVLQSTDMAGSKRIAELEDIIRRKSSTITRLKKDMVVLEQKLVHLTRLRRSSSSSNSDRRSPPFMVDNIIYDMDSTSSPSSSDSDSSPVNGPHYPAVEIQQTPLQSEDPASAGNLESVEGKATRLIYRHTQSRSKDLSKNHKPNRPSSLRPNFKKIKRLTQASLQEVAPKKRWA